MPKIIVTGLLLIFTASACQAFKKKTDNDSEDATNKNGEIVTSVQASIQAGTFPAAVTSLADIDSATPKELSKSDLENWLNKQSSLYYKPKSASTNTATIDISGTPLGKALKCTFDGLRFVVRAKGDLIAMVLDFDGAPCQQYYDQAVAAGEKDDKPSTSSNTTSSSFSMGIPIEARIVLAMQCPGADLTAYNGAVIDKVNELEESTDPTLLAIRKACSLQNNPLLTRKWSITSSTKAREYIVKTDKDGKKTRGSATTITKSGTTSSSGGPCERVPTDKGFTLADCVHFRAKTIVTKTGTISAFDSDPYRGVLRATGLNWQTGTFFTAGSVAFEVDGWKGDLMYKGGAETPPLWNASSSAGDANGTLRASTASTSFGLRDSQVTELRIEDLLPNF